MFSVCLFPEIMSTLVLSSFKGSLFAEAHNWISETDLLSDEFKVAKAFTSAEAVTVVSSA